MPSEWRRVDGLDTTRAVLTLSVPLIDVCSRLNEPLQRLWVSHSCQEVECTAAQSRTAVREAQEDL